MVRIKRDSDTYCQILPINHFKSEKQNAQQQQLKANIYTHLKKNNFFPPLLEISVRSNSTWANLGGERMGAGSVK